MARPTFALSFQLPFDEAIKATEARGILLPEEYYGELQAEARAAAWTVSGTAGIGQIEQVRDSLANAMAKGIGLEEWKRSVEARSWGLTPAHLETVYRTNVQTAYSAGHWRQFEENRDDRPYLMYSAINDSRTRPAHAAMSGHIAPLDDPIWKRWTPPCGYNCRCSQVSLTPEQARARGYDTQQDAPDVQPDPGFGSRPDDARGALEDHLASRGQALGPSISAAVREFIDRGPDDD